jgi:hypothetical protein
MKKITLSICSFLCMAAFAKLHAQDDAAMKAWQNYMTPGDIHKMLAASDGTWNEDITMWMAPGVPATKSTATAENKMILGGVFSNLPLKAHLTVCPLKE